MSDIHVALKDSNSVASAIFESSTSPGVILRGQIDEITGRVLVDFGGAGGFTELTATGTVNGVNAVFSFTQTPTYVVSDHAVYKSTNSSGSTNWSGTTTVTMTIPPTEDIFGWV